MLLRPQPLRMGLNGLSTSIAQLALESNWYERPVTLYLGAMLDGQLVADPDVIFTGVIQDMNGTIGDRSGDLVEMTAESELIFFKRSRNVRYSNNQLQSEYPGDLGLEFLEGVATQKVTWRGQDQTTGQGSGARSGPDVGTKLR